MPDDAKLGVIRLDYDYPAIPGDIDSPESFGYEVVYRTVPGLTFEMAQSGRYIIYRMRNRIELYYNQTSSLVPY